MTMPTRASASAEMREKSVINFKIVIIYTGLMQPHSFIINHVAKKKTIIFIKSVRRQPESQSNTNKKRNPIAKTK